MADGTAHSFYDAFSSFMNHKFEECGLPQRLHDPDLGW